MDFVDGTGLWSMTDGTGAVAGDDEDTGGMLLLGVGRMFAGLALGLEALRRLPVVLAQRAAVTR
jgi:hypothetical protein